MPGFFPQYLKFIHFASWGNGMTWISVQKGGTRAASRQWICPPGAAGTLPYAHEEARPVASVWVPTGQLPPTT